MKQKYQFALDSYRDGKVVSSTYLSYEDALRHLNQGGAAVRGLTEQEEENFARA